VARCRARREESRDATPASLQSFKSFQQAEDERQDETPRALELTLSPSVDGVRTPWAAVIRDRDGVVVSEAGADGS